MLDYITFKLKDLNWELRKACLIGDLEKINKILSNKYVDPNSYDHKGFNWAASDGHLDIIIKLLQDRRFKVPKENPLSIKFAADYEELEVFNLLWHFDELRAYYER